MFWWRVTKYDPMLRNNKGAYLKNEWTSCTDIGRIYDGIYFDSREYMKVEEAYITSVILFMQSLNTSFFRVKSLEKHRLWCSAVLYTDDMVNLYHCLTEGSYINKEEAEHTVRLALRNVLWCKLESKNMKVHFGYDYYMYIGTAHKCSSIHFEIQKLGLFVESYYSPYEEEEK